MARAVNDDHPVTAEEHRSNPAVTTETVQAHTGLGPQFFAVGQLLEEPNPAAEASTVRLSVLSNNGETQTRVVRVSTLHDDGLSWHIKSNQKLSHGRLCARYYVCAMRGCNARKNVRFDTDGRILEIKYRGKHTHDSPTIAPRPETAMPSRRSLRSRRAAAPLIVSSGDVSLASSVDNTAEGVPVATGGFPLGQGRAQQTTIPESVSVALGAAADSVAPMPSAASDILFSSNAPPFAASQDALLSSKLSSDLSSMRRSVFPMPANVSFGGVSQESLPLSALAMPRWPCVPPTVDASAGFPPPETTPHPCFDVGVDGGSAAARQPSFMQGGGLYGAAPPAPSAAAAAASACDPVQAMQARTRVQVGGMSGIPAMLNINYHQPGGIGGVSIATAAAAASTTVLGGGPVAGPAAVQNCPSFPSSASGIRSAAAAVPPGFLATATANATAAEASATGYPSLADSLRGVNDANDAAAAAMGVDPSLSPRATHPPAAAYHPPAPATGGAAVLASPSLDVLTTADAVAAPTDPKGPYQHPPVRRSEGPAPSQSVAEAPVATAAAAAAAAAQSDNKTATGARAGAARGAPGPAAMPPAHAGLSSIPGAGSDFLRYFAVVPSTEGLFATSRSLSLLGTFGGHCVINQMQRTLRPGVVLEVSVVLVGIGTSVMASMPPMQGWAARSEEQQQQQQPGALQAPALPVATAGTSLPPARIRPMAVVPVAFMFTLEPGLPSYVRLVHALNDATSHRWRPRVVAVDPATAWPYALESLFGSASLTNQPLCDAAAPQELVGLGSGKAIDFGPMPLPASVSTMTLRSSVSIQPACETSATITDNTNTSGSDDAAAAVAAAAAAAAAATSATATAGASPRGAHVVVVWPTVSHRASVALRDSVRDIITEIITPEMGAGAAECASSEEELWSSGDGLLPDLDCSSSGVPPRDAAAQRRCELACQLVQPASSYAALETDILSSLRSAVMAPSPEEAAKFTHRAINCISNDRVRAGFASRFLPAFVEGFPCRLCHWAASDRSPRATLALNKLATLVRIYTPRMRAVAHKVSDFAAAHGNDLSAMLSGLSSMLRAEAEHGAGLAAAALYELSSKRAACWNDADLGVLTRFAVAQMPTLGRDPVKATPAQSDRALTLGALVEEAHRKGGFAHCTVFEDADELLASAPAARVQPGSLASVRVPEPGVGVSRLDAYIR